MNDEQKPEETAISLLRDLAMHLDYDANLIAQAGDLNESKSSSTPLYGRVYKDWTLAVAKLGSDNSPEANFARELDAHFKNNGEILYLSNEQGSLWQRLQAHFESPPNILRDVVIPTIKTKLSNG